MKKKEKPDLNKEQLGGSVCVSECVKRTKTNMGNIKNIATNCLLVKITAAGRTEFCFYDTQYW